MANIMQCKPPAPTKNRIDKTLRQSHQLIDDNIDDELINNQQKSDAKLYLPVHISPDNPSLSMIIQKKKRHMELAQHLHAACLSPVKPTMISAVKKHYFKSWPGLTTQIIPKHLPVQLQSTTSEKIKNKQRWTPC